MRSSSQAEQLARREMATRVTTLDDLNGLMRTLMKTARAGARHRDGRPPRSPGRPGRDGSDDPVTESTAADHALPNVAKNRRNGPSQKTVGGDTGEITPQGARATDPARSSRNRSPKGSAGERR